MKIVSGGQTGVDQAALRAAAQCGLACGGWCPPGRACESGVIPPEFPLEETPEDSSPAAPKIPRSQRTEWNVRDSDATLILRPSDESPADAGTDWARHCAVRYGRPYLVCDPASPAALPQILDWLQSAGVRTLNIAGPSERTVPGVGQQVHQLLVAVFANAV